MIAENINWLGGFSGGMLIGLSASLLLLFTGRIAGISGIANSLLVKNIALNERCQNILFLLGLIIGALFYGYFNNGLEIDVESNTTLLIVAGLLVGIGTKLGSGCTSGHGICGISRLSKRSISATLVFMFAAILTVYIKSLFAL